MAKIRLVECGLEILGWPDHSFVLELFDFIFES